MARERYKAGQAFIAVDAAGNLKRANPSRQQRGGLYDLAGDLEERYKVSVGG